MIKTMLSSHIVKHSMLFGVLPAIVAVAGSAKSESEQTTDQSTLYLPLVMRNYDPVYTTPPFGVRDCTAHSAEIHRYEVHGIANSRVFTNNMSRHRNIGCPQAF
jgi:hypothetical protein